MITYMNTRSDMNTRSVIFVSATNTTDRSAQRKRLAGNQKPRAASAAIDRVQPVHQWCCNSCCNSCCDSCACSQDLIQESIQDPIQNVARNESGIDRSADAAEMLCANNLHLHYRSFEIQEKLGEGGFGSVYRVKLRKNGALVALKIVLLEHSVTSADFIDVSVRTREEFLHVQQLRHPNIILGLGCTYVKIPRYIRSMMTQEG